MRKIASILTTENLNSRIDIQTPPGPAMDYRSTDFRVDCSSRFSLDHGHAERQTDRHAESQTPTHAAAGGVINEGTPSPFGHFLRRVVLTI